jgi:hypothetical protein
VRTNRAALASLGLAPDGLPWRLYIDRGPLATELLAPIAARIGYNTDIGGFEAMAMGDVAAKLKDLLDLRDIRTVDTPDGIRECFLSSRPVANIVGPTLLTGFLPDRARTWPARRVTTLHHVRRNTAANATVAPAPPGSPGTVGAPVQVDIASGHLALPLDGAAPFLVKRSDDSGGQPTFSYSRAFAPESLAAFRSARFRCSIGRFEREGAIADSAGYRDAMRGALRSTVYNGLPATFSVARAELVSLLTGIADQVDSLHGTGKVHGDLKPANILMTAGGAQVIDSLDLTPGIKTPAMTPGWAAPEQVIGDAIEPATDQFSFGLILCEIVGGIMYGEEAHFIVPVGGAKVERIRLLRNAGVYLPPELAPVAEPGLGPWQGFLDRCLRFAPASRFGSMKELVWELRSLLSGHPLSGELRMTLGFGRLSAGEGDEPYWELRDVRS